MIIAAQGFLFARPIRSAANYDEAVYLAAARRASSWAVTRHRRVHRAVPRLLRLAAGPLVLTGVGVTPVRAGLLGLTLLGTVGGWLVGRRYGARSAGCSLRRLLVIAPPLDLFGFQVIADTPALALMVLSLGLATLGWAGRGSGRRGDVCGGPLGEAHGGHRAACSGRCCSETACGSRSRLWLVVAVVAGRACQGPRQPLGGRGHVPLRRPIDARGDPHPHRQIFEQIPRGTPFLRSRSPPRSPARSSSRDGGRSECGRSGRGSCSASSSCSCTHRCTTTISCCSRSRSPLRPARRSAPRSSAFLSEGDWRSADCSQLAIGAGWVQQLHRVDLVRDREPASNLAAARALAQLTRPGAPNGRRPSHHLVPCRPARRRKTRRPRVAALRDRVADGRRGDP